MIFPNVVYKCIFMCLILFFLCISMFGGGGGGVAHTLIYTIGD